MIDPEAKARSQKVMEFQDQLESERKEYETLWRDTATYIDPNADDFGAENERRQGVKKSEKVFDNTAIIARDRLAAAHESMLTPRNALWHGLKAGREDLNDDEEVKEYLEAVRDRVFAARYRPKANFASQNGAYFQQLDTFGTAAVFIEDDIGRGLRYKALHLNELYIAEDFAGRVDTVHRKFILTARQAVQMRDAGLFTHLPEGIERTARHTPLTRYWFLHCVYPNAEHYERPGGNSWPIASTYLAYDFAEIVGSGGYRTMPYAVGRYMTGPRETYGRSPGQTVLRTIQGLQEMAKTGVRVAQRITDPPLFLSAQTGVTPFSMRAGAHNWGMMDPTTGRPLVQAFESNADLSALLALVQDGRQTINDAFYVTLFQVLMDKPPNMTATEALLRAQEKGVLLTPTMGRQQSEYLGPLITREIDVLTEAGAFDDLPMPDALREAGAGVEIYYDAPLNRLQRTDEAVGILRLIEALAEPAKIDPGVYDVLDFTKGARTLGDAYGVPARLLRTPEEMAALAEKREQAESMQQAAVAGPAIASAAKDLAQAQATAQSIPQPIPLVEPA